MCSCGGFYLHILLGYLQRVAVAAQPRTATCTIEVQASVWRLRLHVLSWRFLPPYTFGLPPKSCDFSISSIPQRVSLARDC